MPVMSMRTTGSFPTTHPSCPGAMTPTSPGPNSISVPSSILTCRRPEIMYWVCALSQLLVFAIGLTCSDHFQPGSNVARPNLTPPTVAISTLPLGKVRVSSGEFKLFFSVRFISCLLNRSSLARGLHYGTRRCLCVYNPAICSESPALQSYIKIAFGWDGFFALDSALCVRKDFHFSSMPSPRIWATHLDTLSLDMIRFSC